MEKYKKLQEIIKDMGSVVIGFSGGVDSTLLAKVAYDVLGDQALAITLNEAFHSTEEILESKAFAQQIGISQIVITCGLVNEDFIVKNPKDRCYYCKTAVFSTIKREAEARGIKYIIDGSNVDDLGDYRPGLKALEELKVRSPLREAGLTKKEIRQLSKELDLPTWEKPAFACLASRVPYGEEITVEKLRVIEEGEAFIRDKGFKQYRVRHHGDIVRIEVDTAERAKLFSITLLDEIDVFFKNLGFKHVTIEAGGYRMGALN